MREQERMLIAIKSHILKNILKSVYHKSLQMLTTPARCYPILLTFNLWRKFRNPISFLGKH